MRRNLTALFLTYLAAFNLLNLIVGLTRYVVVSFYGPDIRLYSETVCLLHRNIIVFGHLGVNWTILAVAVCKMAYVLVPDTLMKNLPKSFVHVMMLTISVYGYAIVFISGKSDIAHDTESSFGLLRCEQEYMTVAALTQITSTFLMPELATFFVNITTIKAYYYIWTMASPHEKKIVKVNYIMGIMLFISDIQLLLTEVPYIVINTFKPVLFTGTPRGAANYLMACYLSVGALYSNYALNCLTYCFFGGHFRRELRRVFRPILIHVFPTESRWVNSKASLFEELERAQSFTATRLSLNHIFDANSEISQNTSPAPEQQLASDLDMEYSRVSSEQQINNKPDLQASGTGEQQGHSVLAVLRATPSGHSSVAAHHSSMGRGGTQSLHPSMAHVVQAAKFKDGRGRKESDEL